MRLIIILISLLFVADGCARSTSVKIGQKEVVAAFYPIAYVAEQI